MEHTQTSPPDQFVIEIMPETDELDAPPGIYEHKSQRFNPFYGRQLPAQSNLLPQHSQSFLSPVTKAQQMGQIDRQLTSQHLKQLTQQAQKTLLYLKQDIMSRPQVQQIQQFLQQIFPGCSVYGGAANEISRRDGDIDCTFEADENAMEACALQYAKAHESVVRGLGFPLDEYFCVASQINTIISQQSFTAANQALLLRRYKLRKALILAYYVQFLKPAFIPRLVPNARVPVLKFDIPVNFDDMTIGDEHDRGAKAVSVDVCVGNKLPPQNTALLAAYMRQNGQLRDLLLLVKHWAAKRDIMQGIQLNSYFFALLAVFYMQQIKQLTRLQPGAFRVVQGVNCSFNENPPRVQQRYTLGQLLCGFFNFYGNYFDFRDSVVSVRMGRALSRDEKQWPYETSGETTDLSFREHTSDLPFEEYAGQHYDINQLQLTPLPDVEIIHHENKHGFLAVEDPFETFVNVGRNCEHGFAKLVVTEFRRAYAVLKRHEGLSWLFLGPEIDPPGQKQRLTLAELKAKEEENSYVEVKIIQPQEKKKWGLV